MELTYKLLEHPFYKAWSCGEITTEQLTTYHRSYLSFIKEIPNYWNKVIAGFGAGSYANIDIVAEENEHIALWEKWGSKLADVQNFPAMKELLERFDGMTVSELLGAIHAFEIQQPGVAETKKKGLMEYYGFTSDELSYFDEHMNEAEHIAIGSKLADKYADKQEFERGFAQGAEMIYKSLDKFM